MIYINRLYRLGARIFERLTLSDQGVKLQKFSLPPGGLKSKSQPITFLHLLMVYHRAKFYGSASRTVGGVAFCPRDVVIFVKNRFFAYLTLTLTLKVKGHQSKVVEFNELYHHANAY